MFDLAKPWDDDVDSTTLDELWRHVKPSELCFAPCTDEDGEPQIAITPVAYFEKHGSMWDGSVDLAAVWPNTPLTERFTSNGIFQNEYDTSYSTLEAEMLHVGFKQLPAFTLFTVVSDEHGDSTILVDAATDAEMTIAAKRIATVTEILDLPPVEIEAIGNALTLIAMSPSRGMLTELLRDLSKLPSSEIDTRLKLLAAIRTAIDDE